MNVQSKVAYSFGDYLLEVSERRLWKEKNLIPLTPKAFETLVVLVSNKGRVVGKDAILDKVWTDTFVEEGTLAQNILTLRKALGNLEDGRQFIETVPRVGYRFISDVKEIVSDDEIVILEHRVKTEIKAEHKIVSDTETKTVSQPQSLVKTFTDRFKQNKVLTSIQFLVAVIILAGLGFAVRSLLQTESFFAAKFNKIEVSKLTSEGNIVRSAISPDGKYLSFVKINGDEQSIFTKQISGNSTIEVLPPKNQRITGITFSPDGSHLFYTSYENINSTTPTVGHLYRIPMLGGTPQEILADIDSSPTISPDGKQIAFLRFNLPEKISSLIITDINGKNGKALTNRDLANSFSTNGLSWSPDGKTIASIGFISGDNGRQMGILLVDAVSGEIKTLSQEHWIWIGQIDWLKDGSSVVFPAWNSKSGNSTDEIWSVSLDGKAKQISSGINGVFSLNVTVDSNSIAAIRSDRITDFWIASAPDFKNPTKLLQNNSEYHLSPPGISATGNGRILFGSTFNGNLDIWAINSDGKEKLQLTNDEAADYYPIATNDGQTIVFISNRTGRENLWKMKSDGTKQEQLTNEINVSSPTVSPDNKFVYYSALNTDTEKHFLKRVNLETGESIQITSVPASLPRVSPDGKYLACYYPEKTPDGVDLTKLKLTVLSTENFEVIKQFPASFNQNRLSTIEWKDAETLSFVTNQKGYSKIWQQSISSSEPKILSDLPNTSVFRFAWLNEGENLIFEKGETINNAILINSVN